MSLATRGAAMFRRAWQAYGRPRMAVVPPRSAWSIPQGFAYDPLQDQIVDANGTLLKNYSDYWPTLDYLDVLPVTESAEVRVLVAAGIVPSGTMTVGILGADLPTVRAAYAVQLDDEWYDVVDTPNTPAGVGGGYWSRVQLRRRA